MIRPAKKFATFDGLRGAAAIAVVIYHCYIPWVPSEPMPSAYLAVDLFFMLSGFVIGYSYEERLERRMSLASFALVRVIRLYPMYLLGCAISIALILAQSLLGRVDWRDLEQLPRHLITAMFLLPTSVAPGSQIVAFPLNGPSWSLCFELYINLIYAVTLPLLTTRRLAAVTGCAAILLFLVAFEWQTLGIGGNTLTFWPSLARVGFAFPAGLLIFRLWSAGQLPRVSAPAPVILGTFVALLFLPFHGSVAAVLNPLVVTLAFPLLLLLAVNGEPGSGLGRFCSGAGALSYPLYAIHEPLLNWSTVVGGKLGWTVFDARLAMLPAVFIGAWLALRFYDEPVRQKLRRWVSRERQERLPRADDHAAP